MRLGDLLGLTPDSSDTTRRLLPPGEQGALDLSIAGLTADSRVVEPGFAFFALAGAKADGLAYARQAVANGAAVVIGEREPDAPLGAPFVRVADARAALAHAAARFYPRQPGVIVAVTGTSGKTSVAAFVRQIWRTLGREAASLGTIGLVAPSGAVYGSLTTPDPVTLHRTLDRLAGDGVTHLALEASSHGLDQRRLDGVRLAAGGFTNLSRDHLDYHGTAEAYLAAKLRLFDAVLPPGATAVIWSGSDVAEEVAHAAMGRGVHVMLAGPASFAPLRLIGATREGFGMRLDLEFEEAPSRVLLPLMGAFQVANALVAAGLCIACGEAPAAVFAALERLEGAPGRLERVGARHGAPVFVDYAHKPDALDKALEALRPLASGRLIVVFGCGGDRDAGKRPLMGAIAQAKADVVIVTDDNPRSEDPAAVRAAICAGAPSAHEIADRRSAIHEGVDMLREGDVLLIAGKGHETGQIIGDRTLPFSDHDAARLALEACA